MKIAYLFDVDGTLVDANEPIDSQFMHWMETWVNKHDAYLCTNNSYINILPRLGRRLVTSCKAAFTSAGNSIWVNEKEAVVNNWRPSSDLVTSLEDIIKQSDFKIRSGPNIEYRTGLISFSIVGKNASKEERQRYMMWDKTSKERVKIAQKVQETFPNLSVFLSGETSVDICEKGFDKSQVLKYFNEMDSVVFFGNEIKGFGNDKPLAQAMYNAGRKKYNVCQVSSWQETFEYLKKIK